MSQDKPLVSVGLPVFNGETFVGQAIESVLAQDYPEFELILCDNASTDGTARICQAYAEKDRRVRYFRNAYDLGALGNFAKSLTHANGKYFTWVAHDDVLDPSFLCETVAYLEQDCDAVLCACSFRVLDAAGETTEFRSLDMLAPTIPWKKVRKGFFDGLGKSVRYCSLYGLFRTDVLRKVPFGMDRYKGNPILYLWEVLFMARIATLGKVVALAQALRGKRVLAGSLGSHANLATKLTDSWALERYAKRRNFWVAATANVALLDRLGLMKLCLASFFRPSLFVIGMFRRMTERMLMLEKAAEARMQVIHQLETVAEERRNEIIRLTEEVRTLEEKLLSAA